MTKDSSKIKAPWVMTKRLKQYARSEEAVFRLRKLCHSKDRFSLEIRVHKRAFDFEIKWWRTWTQSTVQKSTWLYQNPYSTIADHDCTVSSRIRSGPGSKTWFWRSTSTYTSPRASPRSPHRSRLKTSAKDRRIKRQRSRSAAPPTSTPFAKRSPPPSRSFSACSSSRAFLVCFPSLPRPPPPLSSPPPPSRRGPPIPYTPSLSAGSPADTRLRRARSSPSSPTEPLGPRTSCPSSRGETSQSCRQWLRFVNFSTVQIKLSSSYPRSPLT